MRKVFLAIAISSVALLSVKPIFANENGMMEDSKACAAIAKACRDAGYEKGHQGNKKFWFNCMKPIVMGKTVSDVKIDADTAKQCRADKIDRMKKELDELQNVS